MKNEMVLVAKKDGKVEIVSTNIDKGHNPTSEEKSFAKQLLGKGYTFEVISSDDV